MSSRGSWCSRVVYSTQVVPAPVHVAQGQSDGGVRETAGGQHREEVREPAGVGLRAAALARGRGLRQTGARPITVTSK